MRLPAVETEEDELSAVFRGDRDSEAYLDRVAANLRLQGREVETIVEIGDPARRIVASAGEAELIIMGSHGQGAVGRFLLGSVSKDLIHRAAAPVLLVRAQGAALFQHTADTTGAGRS